MRDCCWGWCMKMSYFSLRGEVKPAVNIRLKLVWLGGKVTKKNKPHLLK